ncbi:MAG: ribosome biogenesis/translation initiation ATPase RLI [Candidatus Aenigmatarchaeota archaeon]|nr:MAG: ribosome biogenesis/translation initiation ATPase RLI [Candidatus Aenigmarchaeota archaeon]
MPRKKRLVVIDRELCNPKQTDYACMKACPVNRSGQDCITISEIDKKPVINEELCIGCGLCVKKCSKNAIQLVNLPEELNETPIHRYGKNMFSLYRLPVPKKNSVIALLGQNGTGKSTVLNILSGQLKPNAGVLDKEVEWDEIIEKFKGTEIQDYLRQIKEKKIKTGYKPQHVDMIPKIWKGKVIDLLRKIGEEERIKEVVSSLGIERVLDKETEKLSGGELQLVAVAAVLLKNCEFYFFDEPSSYLDVYQRLKVAKEIRKLMEKAVVMVVEHDLAVADYLADYTHILYGKPGVFGIVSKTFGVRTGINTYLEGYIKEENVRFREEAIVFQKMPKTFEKTKLFLAFSGFEKQLGNFYLKTEPGNLFHGEIIGILGPNSIGKTTFIKMLVGEIKPDAGEPIEGLSLAYKPQRLVLKAEEENLSVEEFLREKTQKTDFSTQEKNILRVLGVEKNKERTMKTLSGGELQGVFVCATLLKESEVMLFDEPSAFLDVEQRLKLAKILRQYSESKGVACFVVDHDLQFIDSVSDRIMVFEGEKGKKGYAPPPYFLEEGMNVFLKRIGTTYRRDPATGRARANKPGSQKDIEQKKTNTYYYTDNK